MTSFIIVVVLCGSIAGLGAVLVMSQRQYDVGDPDPDVGADRAVAGPPPLPPPMYASGLSALLASTIEEATRDKPRNLAEADAVGTLRSALVKAIDGEFGAEVRAVIEATAEIRSLHDVRPIGVGDDPLDRLMAGPEIDHLVVCARGVIVIDSKVRFDKVTYDDDAVFVGRGEERCRDSMVDEVVREMAAVAPFVDPVPVHGIVVLRDVLALPPEIRSVAVEVQGVRLITIEQLRDLLTEDGPVVDTAVIAARLEQAFEPALADPDDRLTLDLMS